MVGVARIELATPAMSTQCSTTELHAHTGNRRLLFGGHLEGAFKGRFPIPQGVKVAVLRGGSTSVRRLICRWNAEPNRLCRDRPVDFAAGQREWRLAGEGPGTADQCTVDRDRGHGQLRNHRAEYCSPDNLCRLQPEWRRRPKSGLRGR